jgi:hypothetical protein
VFDVRGTTVITPRPWRSTDRLAASLDTITEGRAFFASLPRVGS